MRLSELNPEFLSTFDTKEGETKGAGVQLNCPCGDHTEDHRLYVPFKVSIGPGPYKGRDTGWNRTGETFEDLTLTPSIYRVYDHCKWHGFITNGEIITV